MAQSIDYYWARRIEKCGEALANNFRTKTCHYRGWQE